LDSNLLAGKLVVVAHSVRAELARLERAAAEVEDLTQLGGAPLTHLVRAVGASSAMMFQFEEGGPRFLGGDLCAAMASYDADMFTEDEIQKAGLRCRQIVTPILLHRWSELDWRTHERSLTYNDFYQRVGVEWFLCVHLDEEDHGASGQTGIVLTRSRREQAFDDAELEVAFRAASALRLAKRRAARFALLQGEAAAGRMLLADRAMLTATPAGRVLWLSHKAESMAQPWLGLGGWLREPFRTLVRERSRRPKGDELSLAPVRLTVARLSVELWLTRDDRGRPLVAIELRDPRATPHQGVAALARAHRLTPAETRVLAALGDALSNREIANLLGVSLETARTHVAHVLAKLGVPSRTEAALRIARALPP
jgi:DNA-binding CsgD family transcriptional regulator